MKWIPDNIPLAVAWRLLLLVATVVIVLAIGMHQFDWQPVGEKTMPEQGDGVDLVIQQEMGTEIDAEPVVDDTPDAQQATPETEPSPTPAPTPKPSPTPQGNLDEGGLVDFLEGELGE